ncbi:MAG: Uma2 family endonuclease [Isosphaeraceae bacterium]
MTLAAERPKAAPIEYPDSDGQPMAENTRQYEWIVTIKEGLGDLFRDDPDVFVAGDLLWYPVEGDNKTRVAPDVLVALGRPRGHRGSYKQWEEGGAAPQVVFEILSPGNSGGEMARKTVFYHKFGVREFYILDPDSQELSGWELREGGFVEIAEMNGWTSPLIGIRFEFDKQADTWRILRPDGRRFLTFEELARFADAETARADAEKERADEERRRADEERRRVDALLAQLRALGIEPEV